MEGMAIWYSSQVQSLLSLAEECLPDPPDDIAFGWAEYEEYRLSFLTDEKYMESYVQYAFEWVFQQAAPELYIEPGVMVAPSNNYLDVYALCRQRPPLSGVFPFDAADGQPLFMARCVQRLFAWVAAAAHPRCVACPLPVFDGRIIIMPVACTEEDSCTEDEDDIN